MRLNCSGVLALSGWVGVLSDTCLEKPFDWFEDVFAGPVLFEDFHWSI